MASSGWQISDLLGIARAQFGLVPVVAADFVVLGDVELALEEGDAVRLIQSRQDFDDSLGFAGLLGIGQCDHPSLLRFADE